MKKKENIKSVYDDDGLYLGLDISSSVIGVSIIDKNEKLFVLDSIKLTSSTLYSLYDKADRGIEELKRIVGNHKINKIFVEANAKMFTKGFSSADTLMTLAKINGIISYLSHKAFGAKIIDVNVSSARKAIGFKNVQADKRPVKEKLFAYVTSTLHPEYPWKKYTPTSGKNKGQEIYDPTAKDSCDAWVIVCGGNRILKEDTKE